MVSPAITGPLDPGVWRTTPSSSAPAATRRWSLRRTHVVVGTGAAVIAVWLGVTAPSVSPVSPSPVPVEAVAGTAGDPTGTSPDKTVADPQDSVAVEGPRGVRGRGR